METHGVWLHMRKKHYPVAIASREMYASSNTFLSHHLTLLQLPCYGPDSEGDARCNNCRCSSRPPEECVVEETSFSIECSLSQVALERHSLCLFGGISLTRDKRIICRRMVM